MPRPVENSDTKYTYQDYLTWPDDERWEIIHGVAHVMSPAPTRYHQSLSRDLEFFFHAHLKNKPGCEVYDAPFDVRFPHPLGKLNDFDKADTVIQPDLLVVCDPEKLTDRGCDGAPDLIVEILSPSTTYMDLNNKYALYQEQGVKEYWVVYPEEQIIDIHFHNEETGLYDEKISYRRDDVIECRLLPGLDIPMSEVFKSAPKDNEPPVNRL